MHKIWKPLSLLVIASMLISACSLVGPGGLIWNTNPPAVAAPANTQAPALPAATERPALPEPTAQSSGLGTSSAPQTYEDASKALGVPVTALTPLYPKPGDPTVIGWKIGMPPYQKTDKENPPYFTSALHTGYCVDYPPSRTTIAGDTTWHVSYAPVDWNRALMSGNGTIKSQEVTIYWSPCEKGSSYKDVTSSVDNSGKTASADACDFDLSLIGGKASDWKAMPNTNGEGFKYGPNGPAVKMIAPAFGRVDYPGGSLTNGQSVEGVTEATFWTLGGCP